MTNEHTTLDHPEKTFSDVGHDSKSQGNFKYCLFLYHDWLILFYKVTNHSEEVSSSSTEVEHDGGYGWLVVLGAFFVQVTSFGTITSW